MNRNTLQTDEGRKIRAYSLTNLSAKFWQKDNLKKLQQLNKKLKYSGTYD